MTKYIHIQTYGDDRKRIVVQFNVLLCLFICLFVIRIFHSCVFPFYNAPNVKNHLHFLEYKRYPIFTIVGRNILPDKQFIQNGSMYIVTFFL